MLNLLGLLGGDNKVQQALELTRQLGMGNLSESAYLAAVRELGLTISEQVELTSKLDGIASEDE